MRTVVSETENCMQCNAVHVQRKCKTHGFSLFFTFLLYGPIQESRFLKGKTAPAFLQLIFYELTRPFNNIYKVLFNPNLGINEYNEKSKQIVTSLVKLFNSIYQMLGHFSDFAACI